MGQFLKQTFASAIGTIAGLLLFLALGSSSLVFLLFAAASLEETPKIKNKSVLVFDLSTSIKDTKPPSRLAEVVSGQTTTTVTLRQVLEAIATAADDPHIVGILLDGRNTGVDNGYATLKEVRTALEDFQESGKKVIAYDVDLSEQEYYLTSTADTVILNPLGIIEINGLSSEQVFLAGALEKYGIGVQVIRVGEYKSAVEPFTRKNLSPENRQQTLELLTDLWGEFRTAVGKSRDLSPEKIQAIADNKGFLASSEALVNGFVDRIGYFDEVIADLKEITEVNDPDKSFEQISLDEYIEVSTQNAKKTSENKIAVVYVEGTIVGGEGDLQQIGGDRLAKELRELRQDKNVKGIVLRINSPGGSATASEIILREVQLIRKEKPVIVSMGNVAASGGYWISTGANYIFADATTITGSIGVFGLLPNFQEIANDNGISWDVVKTGKLADIGSTIRPKSDLELARYQEYVDRTYDLFLNKVAESRNLPKEKVEVIAQGKVWSGIDAQKIGLVDEIGGLETAIAYAAKKAKLGNDWEVQEYPKNRGLEEKILESLLSTEALRGIKSADPLTAELDKLKSDLAIFDFKDPKGIYTILPFKLRID